MLNTEMSFLIDLFLVTGAQKEKCLHDHGIRNYSKILEELFPKLCLSSILTYLKNTATQILEISHIFVFLRPYLNITSRKRLRYSLLKS